MIPQLARSEEFPLYDIVSQFQPTYVMSDFFVYSAAPMTEIDAEQLSHFGMGVFWKASVHNWRSKAGLFRIDLGPYADEIRRFLLDGSFPEHAALWVCVVPPTVPLLKRTDAVWKRTKRSSTYLRFTCRELRTTCVWVKRRRV